MDKQVSFQKIASTINTLNLIELHGKQNLSYMLGCIQTLEEILEDVLKDTEKQN